MGLASVEIRDITILKDFKDTDVSRYYKEVKAYTELSFATPRIICHNEYWIEVERLTPILELPKEESIRFRDDLRELCQKIHDYGYWHCDIDLVNVVVHPTRGVLLIDWENLREATGEISYDIYGAVLAGVEPSWEGKGENGVFWYSDSLTSPGKYWE